MTMMSPLLLVIGSVIVIGAGVGIAWFYFFGQASKMVSWDAHIFQPSDSILPPIRNKDGKIL